LKKTIASVAAVAALAVPAVANGHDGAAHHRLHLANGAVQACKAERANDLAAFRQKYGNAQGRHAFRRCVRQHLKQAVTTCKAERANDLAAFRQKYANAKGRHAFRRCVRQHAGDPIS
jgi:hypothetical protein